MEWKKNNDGKEYWWCMENRAGKCQWVLNNTEDHGKRTVTSPSCRGVTKAPGEGDRNTNLTLSKDFKACLISIKDQIYVQAFFYQLNINAKVNE